jgi:hypothetical protein
MAKKKKRRSLGSSPEVHLSEMGVYVNQAARELKRAMETDKCAPSGSHLFDARDSLGKALAHAKAGGSVTARQRKALDSLNQRVNTAIDGYLNGPCVRRTPYGDK